MLTVLTDRIDSQIVLSRPAHSRFQRFWEPPSLIIKDNGDPPPPMLAEKSLNMRYCVRFASDTDFQNLFTPPDDGGGGGDGGSPLPQPKIPYKWLPSSFIVKQCQTQLAFHNKHIIWLSRERKIPTSLGISLYIPEGFFGITFYKCLDAQFVCMPELIEPGLQMPQMDIVNLSYNFQAIFPGTIEGDIGVFPCFAPEPWQLMNVPPPNEHGFFTLRTRHTVIIRAGHTQTVYFDAAYVHAPGICALIVGTRHFSQSDLIIRPTIWLPGTVACVTVVNASGTTVCISPNTTMTKVVFTTRRFAYLLVGSHPIGQLIVPPTPELGFTHTPEHALLQRLSGCAGGGDDTAADADDEEDEDTGATWSHRKRAVHHWDVVDRPYSSHEDDSF
ncbi:deoxyuridine triphosphatase [Panine betaherpesvirus 2]|uniref:Deoxyuridine triphosphatase n=1 Tax=Panine betaherpesvirus 2 TaxID=188763 RepID=Q8QS27_9BETA|nr:deoxyuridine triphosphatase [Panine betaherpesvirus 2]AAM00711.1 deoxyuridine triphosphatase [Panine betaherpesvirus 2]QXV67819.1 deoxyuridine triphosphatase [Panine betaherpesvirus 2]